MTVKDVLAKRGWGMITLDPQAPISAAVGVMRREGLTALAVSRDGKEISGLLSEYDVMRAMRNDTPERVLPMPVGRIMARRFTRCRPDDSLRHVMTRMSVQRTRHAAVMSEHGLCGVVSMAEIVEHRLAQAEREIAGARELCMAAP